MLCKGVMHPAFKAQRHPTIPSVKSTFFSQVLLYRGMGCFAGGIDYFDQIMLRKNLIFVQVKFKTCVRYLLFFPPNDGPPKTMKNVFYFI